MTSLLSPPRHHCALYCALQMTTDESLCTAPRLLAGGDSITPILPSPPSPSPTCSSPSFETLPPVLDCVFEPPPSLPEGYALPPTHLLTVTCPSTSSAHSHDHAARGPPQRVLVPIHALPWSLVSPLLAARLAACAGPVQADAAPPAGPPTPPSSPPSPSSSLSASPPTARLAPPPTAHLALPVVPLVLPSLAGLAALHAFVYTRTLGSPWPQHSLFDEDALEGVVACAEALGVEGEAGRELGEVVERAWAESGWEEDGEGSEEGWSGQREEEDGEQGMASD